LIFVSESLGPLREQTATVLSDLERTANDTNTAIVAVDPRGLQVGRVRGTDTLLSLAGGSGGEFVYANDLNGPLRKIVNQASAFYLLGYDGSTSPVDGKFHEIKVRLKRAGLHVKARSGYWAPRLGDMARARAAAAAAELPPAIARAFAELPPEGSRRPVTLWVGTAPGPDGSGTVSVAWAPSTGARERAAAAVELDAVHAAGDVLSGAVDPHGSTFGAPPGEVTLTFMVKDAAGEIIDRDVRRVTVPEATRATLALSTPVVFRARTSLELRALNEAAGPPVHAGRDFERQDRIRIRVGVYGSESAGASVSARLLGVRGTPLSSLPVQPGGQPGVFQVEITPGSISRGQYVIALLAEKDTHRMEALVPFRVR
jgi:hypothetical protein